VSSFAFVGKLSSSKSLFNRLLLIQSYFPELELRGESQSDDVVGMRAALEAWRAGREIPVGAAGTILRFMALRASREPGEYVLRGSSRLFGRPQGELIKLLRQLGVEAQLTETSLRLVSKGWHLQGDTLMVSTHNSSQFISSLLLNSWSLPFDLYVSPTGPAVSEGYWRMSVKLAQDLGMRVDFWDRDFRVPAHQTVRLKSYDVETDVSSAFVVAALAAVSGSAKILNFPFAGLQPDIAFVEILRKMGVPVEQAGSTLVVHRALELTGVSVNLSSCPDLFPVLAALCALAVGESRLYGAPQLVNKESNRLLHMAEWVRLLGRSVHVLEDHSGMVVAAGSPIRMATPLTLSCDQDHRLAFAAAVWRQAGFDVSVRDPEVVSKSFPDFWRYVR